MRLRAAALLTAFTALLTTVDAQAQRVSETPPRAQAALRIAFGTPAEEREFLSTAMLMVGPQGRPVEKTCSATVIDAEWLLTAAHCLYLDGGVAAPEQVRARIATLRRDRNQGRMVEAAQIVPHPDFRGHAASPHDIGLVRLRASVGLPRQMLVSAATRGDLERADVLAVVMGFGLDERNQPATGLLRADLPLVPEQTCRIAWAGVRDVPPDAIGPPTVCAGWQRGGAADACGGDSGGPLLALDPHGRRVQVGVVSWGDSRRCGTGTRPAVFTSVAYHGEWIRRHVPQALFHAGEAGTSPPVTPTGPAPAPLPPFPPVPERIRPSARPHLALDILEGSTLRPGTRMHVRIGSSISGHLVVFAVFPDGTMRQVFPNAWSREGAAGVARTRLVAGQVTLLPGPAEAFELIVAPTPGRAVLRAIVLPDAPGVHETITAQIDMQSIANPEGYIRRLMQLVRAETTRSMRIVLETGSPIPPGAAMAEAWFTIVP